MIRGAEGEKKKLFSLSYFSSTSAANQLCLPALCNKVAHFCIFSIFLQIKSIFFDFILNLLSGDVPYMRI